MQPLRSRFVDLLACLLLVCLVHFTTLSAICALLFSPTDLPQLPPGGSFRGLCAVCVGLVLPQRPNGFFRIGFSIWYSDLLIFLLLALQLRDGAD